MLREIWQDHDAGRPQRAPRTIWPCRGCTGHRCSCRHLQNSQELVGNPPWHGNTGSPGSSTTVLAGSALVMLLRRPVGRTKQPRDAVPCPHLPPKSVPTPSPPPGLAVPTERCPSQPGAVNRAWTRSSLPGGEEQPLCFINYLSRGGGISGEEKDFVWSWLGPLSTALRSGAVIQCDSPNVGKGPGT